MGHVLSAYGPNKVDICVKWSSFQAPHGKLVLLLLVLTNLGLLLACWVLGVWVLVLGDGSCCWAMEQKQGLGAGRRKGNPTPSLS